MDKKDYNKLWKDTLEILQISVSDATFKTYLSHTHLMDIKEIGDRVIAQIGCESVFIKQQVEQRYFGLIQDTLNKELEKQTDLTFIVKQYSTPNSDVSEKPSPLFDQPK